MPELPEVEVVRLGLDPVVTGSTVAAVEVFDARSLRRHDQSNGSFASLIVGSQLLPPVRRGKFLWIPLARSAEPVGFALLTHLGMSGQVLVRAPESINEAHLRIRVQLDHPIRGEVWMNFVDQRIFGSMSVDRLVPTGDGLPGGLGTSTSALPSMVEHIARDPLDPAFDDDAFCTGLLGKNTGIKRAMLDQTFVSGIGNIYADESLWAAKIHYAELTSTLGRARALGLLDEIRNVLLRALAEGGTSFDAQYVNVNGASGYFSHSLNVYGRQGEPCPRCGSLIVRERFMNRSSHLCPTCQPLQPTTFCQLPSQA